ncbi:MAG: right-handed parallel beta-helix repeat-containing protein [Bacteroidales bacterium]|nr:right-handed parallel beta-helix repeat-containing protein [Bacteroidales bacterium]
MKKLLLTTLLLLAVTMSGIAQKMKNVTVTNANDFVKAIAPNTNITIKSNGILSITDAIENLDIRNISNMEWKDYPSLAPGAYCVEVPDGFELVVVNVNNLTITGGGSEMTHIQAKPSYAQVISFYYCNNITMKNIMAGHVERGDCSGDVLFFYHCKKMLLDKCDLYGCGVNGIWMESSNDVTVNFTEIHDCSEDFVVIRNSNNILFNECTMHDCGGGLNVDEESSVDYQKCNIQPSDYEGDYDYYDGDEGGEGDYGYEGNCPNELMEAMNAAGSIFEKKLNNNLVNGALYEEFSEECGYIVIPEDGDWYAAYLPQINDDGQYEFLFLDNVNVKNGEKMFFGSCHVVVQKKEGRFSYEIRDNALKSVTSITGSGNNQTYSHGKDKNSLKKCTKQEAMKHFEFDYELIDVEAARETDEVYPWG